MSVTFKKDFFKVIFSTVRSNDTKMKELKFKIINEYDDKVIVEGKASVVYDDKVLDKFMGEKIIDGPAPVVTTAAPMVNAASGLLAAAIALVNEKRDIEKCPTH